MYLIHVLNAPSGNGADTISCMPCLLYFFASTTKIAVIPVAMKNDNIHPSMTRVMVYCVNKGMILIMPMPRQFNTVNVIAYSRVICKSSVK